MKRFFGLLRFGLPYILYWLPGVLLLAGVGFFDALRMAFFVPILSVVLKPDNRSSALPLFPFASPRWQFDIHALVGPALHIHNVLTVVAWALVGSTVIKGICDYVGTYLVNYAGFGLVTDLRNKLYEVIMRRSASFFHRHPTGTILSTLINDVDKVQTSVSTVLGDFLQQFFTFLFTVALVIMLGGRLSWVLLLFVPVVVTSARRIGRSVQTRTRTGQDKLAEIQNILHETVTGHRIVKAFSNELFEITRFRNAARRLFRANLRSVRIQSISSPLMDTIGSIAIAFLLWIGRNEIQHGRMDAAVFITFIIALFKLYDPVRRFAVYYNNFHQAMGASVSIFDFLEHHDEVKEVARAKALPAFKTSIQFDNVGFSYSNEEGEHQILHNVDLEVRSGEILALVGPSGAGKSTLVNLIPRFFDVTSGRILIDGRDIREVTLSSLRRQIAQVTQETILFNDTVAHNIAYGQPDIKRDLVEEAARHALAHDFIQRMPQGYDTVIGEKGFRLSGGERQRIAIARAILKNAPILILDEATSALDAESESLVQAALGNLVQGRTVVVIAHRLSTVRRAHRIAVLEEGRVTAIRPHDELLTTSPTYRRLYQLQFRDVADAPDHGLDQLEPESAPSDQLLEAAISRETED
ncbi:ABC transporter ATP-binding protein [Acidobacteria bacterium AB60]|nr:ABC transporter ATP-binding protein [Acidobacteria bacterium AB60]